MRRGAVRTAIGSASLVLFALAASPAAAQSIGPGEGSVRLIRVGAVSLEELLADPTVAALARTGGAGLMPRPDLLGTTVDTDDPAREISSLLAESDGSDVTVIVVAVLPSAPRDLLFPVVLGTVSRGEALPTTGEPGALTSDSTHRVGVVTDADVLATVAALGGAEDGAGGATEGGRQIRVVDGPPPFELHRRYLERQANAVPVGVGFGILVTLIASMAIAALAWPWRWTRRGLVAISWAILSVPVIALSLLLVGHLRTLTAVPVVLAVMALTVLGTAIAIPAARRDPDRAPGVIGAVVIAGLALEASIGWDAALFTFLGGSELDGARFYGLPNAFMGLLVGGALLVAWRRPRILGTVVQVLVGFLAGLPWLGANVGAATTAFASTGIWRVVRGRRRADLRALLVIALWTAAGMSVVLAAHALAPQPTHVQAALEAGGAFSHYLDRLAIGGAMLRDNPFALIPALGPLALLALVLRPPAPIAAGFEASPGSKEVALTSALAAIVAYVANDTGASAAGLTWGLGMVLTLWVSLRAAASRMVA